MNPIQLDLFQFRENLSFRRKGSQIFIFDPIRQKYLVQTPEEVVRQLIVLYLAKEKNYPLAFMAIEKSLTFNDLQKRFDLLAFDRNYKPHLLVECKSPDVEISHDTFFQIGIYNLKLEVPFLMVTNGEDTYCYAVDYGRKSFTFLKEVPPFPSHSSG